MMSHEHTSPQALLNQLAQCYLKQAAGLAHLVRFGESAEDVAQLRKKLQLKLFNSLLGNLPGPFQHDILRKPLLSGCGRLGPKEHLLMISFKMRQHRKFDEAQQLELLLNHLSTIKEQSVGQADFIDRVLELLLALAGTKQITHKPALGHRRLVLPTMAVTTQEENCTFPEGDWFHGDGRHTFKCDQNRPYVHYGRELFEGEGVSQPGEDSGVSSISSNESHFDTKLFETEPGRDLLGNRLFAIKGIMDNTHERRTRETLFGGLVHSHVTSIDAKLSLPDLPDSKNPAFLGLKIARFAESPLSDDEGYHESLSGSVASTHSTPERENVWDAALRYQPSRHRTWEDIGNHPKKTDRPYVTEAGAAVLDQIYKLRCEEAAILQGSPRSQLTVLGDQRRLIQNLWSILLGLPSELFVWETESASFVVNPNICLTGTTPESLHQPLSEFATAGTDYTRLWRVSQQPIADSSYTGGLVLQAFLGAIRRYLQYYNAQVLLAQSQMEYADREVTLLLVRTIFSRLMAQLRYLARLCACDERKGTKPGGLDDPLAIGIQLLSYLYKEALDNTGTDNYRLMLSLLRSSCAPYLMFIQDWIFHGICRDAYGEFMIHANHTYLFYRDKHYWTHGYVLMSGEEGSTVPLFLQELSTDIYVCGKSINLLKQCAPEHFVCNVSVDTPRIGLTFSPEELNLVTSRTKTYVKHMEVLAGQLTVSRREKERREEEARVKLLAVARQTAAEEQQKHNEMVKEQREAVGTKKRKEFLALKEQMQKDLLRRGQMQEDEREEDRERMEELTRREHAAEEVESELEKQAREDMIGFYADLAKQATTREQRALWRIRRRQLDKERIAFLQKERDALNQELGAPPSQYADSEVRDANVRRDDTHVSTIIGIDAQEGTGATVRDGLDGEVNEAITTGESLSQLVTKTGTVDYNMSTLSQVDSNETDIASHVSSEVKQGARASNVAPEADRVVFEKGDDAFADDDDWLEVGENENVELEPVLALIRGSQQEGMKPKKSKLSTKSTKYVKAVTIDEFLPRVRPQEDAVFRDSGDDIDVEQARDTTVEDVLLEIGSSLPTQDPAMEDGLLQDAAGRGNILDDILGGEMNSDRTESGDGIVGLPHRLHQHGHPSQSSLHSTSTDDATVPGIPRRSHEHGHISESSHTLDSGDAEPSGNGVDGVGIPVHGLPLRPHSHGHVTDSSLKSHGLISDGQSEESRRLEGVPHLKHQHGHVSASSMGTGNDDIAPQGSDFMSLPELPRRSHVHGHPSQSSLQGSGTAESKSVEDLPLGVHRKSVHGHVSDSSLATSDHPTQADVGADRVFGLPHRHHVHGHSSDSTVQETLMDPKPPANSNGNAPTVQAFSQKDETVSGLPHRPLLERPSTWNNILSQAPEQNDSGRTLEGVPHRSNAHGHASDSSARMLLYPSQSALAEEGLPVVKDGGKGVITMMRHGHPSDSSVQKLMYPVKITKDEQEQAIVEAVELPVTVWADQGREVSEFNFNMFEGLPDTDLLGRTGYVPLKSEIGDYGVQASESDSIEATDLLPLPIIIKRSITAPLRAQVWLVNQSILDYFLVDLRIDKHFVALRRFLFLQDGEFGQALCDQIFDKLSHCVHLQDLLSPITLNQILSRAIQLSASSNSGLTENLSFALKWYPSVFKPNAIDTLDCLELRYHVEWPNNVVITDACLSKYNRVFSFLLQLKRTGWVLRDIHHQLKISAMLHQASGSPQYHQLQLFRHEMQHFVNVMQGYVVNQVIHVSWGEFQKDLKHNVHNLDDLREKHALYLNKAILRCLLNKKAAPVMKIICDILTLVLKVRTQLTSSPWAWDASSGQVIHPCFRNIKKSYMAFKEYSGFLYKVVAKLVTRGYQPHLEEFMLRLNFNNYYQEHKS